LKVSTNGSTWFVHLRLLLWQPSAIGNGPALPPGDQLGQPQHESSAPLV